MLDESAAAVQSLWALMNTPDIETAVASLRVREGILPKNEKRDIGVWQTGDRTPPLITGLPEWAAQHGLDAVIWTNLGRKFDGIERPATVDEIIGYLETLVSQKRNQAEEYICRVPPQVTTAYRWKIVEALGWDQGRRALNGRRVKEEYPHLKNFFPMLDLLNKESHRGAVLIACSYLDNQLSEILAAFMLESTHAQRLLDGFNAPLGTFAARIAAAAALGLISADESRECDLLRRIRNEFAHKVNASFDDERVMAITQELKFAAKAYDDVVVSSFGAFNTAAAALIITLTNRAHYVGRKRLTLRGWPK